MIARLSSKIKRTSKEMLIKSISFIKWRLKALMSRYYLARVKMDVANYGDNLTVNGPSNVNNQTSLGDNVNFNGISIRGSGDVEIGDNFHSGPDCRILTRNHNYEGKKIPYDENYVEKEVKIEDNVWIGAEVLILPGVTIKEGAIIQAGAVVVDDIPKCGIAGGAPAEVFKYRDKEHYERLKSEGSFH